MAKIMTCEASTIQVVDKAEIIEVVRACEREMHPWGEHWYYLNGERVTF